MKKAANGTLQPLEASIAGVSPAELPAMLHGAGWCFPGLALQPCALSPLALAPVLCSQGAGRLSPVGPKVWRVLPASGARHAHAPGDSDRLPHQRGVCRGAGRRLQHHQHCRSGRERHLPLKRVLLGAFAAPRSVQRRPGWPRLGHSQHPQRLWCCMACKRSPGSQKPVARAP